MGRQLFDQNFSLRKILLIDF